MGVDRAIDITAKQRKIVTDLLERHLPNTTAWIYGSRAKWASRPQSDLDMVVFSALEQNGRVSDLREAFEESNLPFRVDLFVWDAVPEQFRKQIKRDHVVLVEREERDVAGGWREFEFASLCDITRGASPRPIHEWIAEEGIPWVKISDASRSRSRFIARTRERIRSDGSTKSVSVFPGDLILSNSATPGIPMFMSIEACIHDGWLLLRDFRDIDKLFCYYLLLYEKTRIVRQSSGTVFNNLKTEILKRHRVSIPRLPEQRAIAHILGTLDDKIELNRRMNETLDAMARALFKSWFVDFDPVRAKMEGRDTGLPSHLADLFPDRLVDSDLGEIPEGWESQSIYRFTNVVYGAAFASKQFNDDKLGVPLIRIRDLSTHEPGVSTEQVHKKGHLIKPGDIVVGMDGEFRLHVWKGPKAWLNQRVCHFKPRSGVPTAFIAEALREPLAFFERGKVGTTVIHLGKSDIDTFRLLHPGQGLLNAFAGIAKPLLDRTVTNALENRALAHARNLVLPKLISGEIRVHHAEI